MPFVFDDEAAKPAASGRFVFDDGQDPGAKPDDHWEITKGFLSGIDQLQGLGYGVAGLAGDAVGADDLKNWGVEGYKRNMDEAQQNAGRVSRWEDINNLNDFLDYALYGVGNVAPTIVASVAGGGAGALVGKQIAKGAVRKLMDKGLTEEAAKLMVKRTAQGSAAGAYGASLGMEAGGIYGDAAQDGHSAPGTALAFGAAAAALDTVLPMKLLNRMGIGKTATREILADAGKMGLAKHVAKNAAGDAGIEALTEGGQTIVERAAAKWLDENKDVFSPEGWSEITNSMALGGIGGAAASLAAAPFEDRTGGKGKPKSFDEALGGVLKLNPDELSDDALLDIIAHVYSVKPSLNEADIEKADKLEEILNNLAEKRGLFEDAQPPQQQPEQPASPEQQRQQERGLGIPGGLAAKTENLRERLKGRRDQAKRDAAFDQAEQDRAKSDAELQNQVELDSDQRGVGLPYIAKRIGGKADKLAASLAARKTQDSAPKNTALGDALLGAHLKQANQPGADVMPQIDLPTAESDVFVRPKKGEGDSLGDLAAKKQEILDNYDRMTPEQQAQADELLVQIDGLQAQAGKQQAATKAAPAPDQGAPVARGVPGAANDSGEAKSAPVHDPRLKRREFRDFLQWSATNDFTPGGGIALVPKEGAKATSSTDDLMYDVGAQNMVRTPSVNPPWVQALLEEEGVSVKYVRNAVKKTLAGEKLGVKQQRVVSAMLDHYSGERVEHELGHAKQKRLDALNLRRKARAAKPITEADLANMQGPKHYAEEFDGREGELDAGQQYDENFYLPEWNDEGRTLAELHAEAAQVDENAADVVLERAETNAQAASELWAIIEKGKTNEQAGQQEAADDRQGADAVDPGQGQGGQEERGQAPAPEAGQQVAPTKKSTGTAGLELEQQTQADIEAQQKAEDQRQADEKAAEDKAKADAQRDDFVLAGSDRPADQAEARGQKSLLDQPAKPKEPDGRRAKAGGEYGVNGEWYTGGQFMPSSAFTIKGAHKAEQGKGGGGRVLVEPGLYGDLPAGKASIFSRLQHFIDDAEGGKLALRENMPDSAFDAHFDGGRDEASDLVNRYNLGQRFIGKGERKAPAQKPKTEAREPFTPTHELPDGTEVVASDEPGVWLDRDDNEIEDDNAEPIGQKPQPKAEPKQASDYGKQNKVFTEDAAAKARELLRKKLSQLNTGLDPELVSAGITLAGYHIEAGARKFADFTKAMIADMGEGIRPYLRSFYEGARHFPGFDNAGMESAAEIDAQEKSGDSAVVKRYPGIEGTEIHIVKNDKGYGVSMFDTDIEKYLPSLRQFSGDDALAKATEYADSIAEKQPALSLVDKLRGQIDEITDNRKLKAVVAEHNGVAVSDVTEAMLKDAQEAMELALVYKARDLVAEGGTDEQIYGKLLDLYRNQPTLNVRSSTSMENQAYSTPAPIAYLASRLAGIDRQARVYEPTAGNGMLLIGADPAKTSANELNDLRRSQLQEQGFDTTGNDATAWVPGQASFDSVIMNPPFGKLRDEGGRITPVKYDGYTIKAIDHLIAAKALEAMADNGKAVLIIGASKKAGDIGPADRTFFNWLYGNYNVVDHFEINGDLYNRQGAGWPIRVITVNGRQRSGAISPVNGSVERVDTWEQVYDRYTESLAAVESQPTREGRADGASKPDAENEPGSVRVPDGREAGKPDSRGAKEPGAGGRDSRNPARPDARGPVGERPAQDGRGADLFGEPVAADEQGQDGRQTDGRRGDTGQAQGANPAQPGGKPGDRPSGVAGSDYQATYVARSGGFNEAVLTPVNMADATNKALTELEARVGDIDTFVMRELGYPSIEAMHKAFMGLQVDTIAAGIDNLSKGKGLIIADQTGVGKGRQAAGMIRYALRQGKIPVFMTVKDNLFTDMFNDLADIGSNDVKPLILNQDGVIKQGKKVIQKNKPRAQHKAMLQGIAATGELPDGFNAIFLTYSQINTPNLQREVMAALGERAMFVLDESHNASGEREKILKGGVKQLTGAGFVHKIIEGAPVVYLSATYAKRPDNMPIYYRTDLADAVDNIDELVDAVGNGGVPLQTVMSGMLAETGQLFRRERSFDGISISTEIDTENGAEHAAIADKVTEGLRAVVEADKAFHDVFFNEVKVAEQMTGGDAFGAGNRAGSGVDHQNFTSVVHNYVAQLLLALKAGKAAKDAIALHRRGIKPVIALENTMGAFLANYVEEAGLQQGDLVDADFRDVMLRALERTRRISRLLPNGDREVTQIGIDQLDPYTRSKYDKAMEIIEGLGIDELPLSPIDYVRSELTKAGINVAEITGRDLTIDYTSGEPILSRRDAKEQKDKRGTVDAFNNGELDALVLNAAGSTGLSIHASERFKDQKPRHMMVMQASGDINVLMQMLGRINRTGQVELPTYTMMGLDIPAEKRPLARTAKKMKSLNANTSANAESDTSINATDMLNKYGDKIVADYLSENYESLRALDIEPGEYSGLALKFTGRMALLPVEQQRQIYEEIESAYEARIEYLNKTGQNDLEPTTVDLDARIMRTKVAYEGRKPGTVFGGHTFLHKIDAKYQGNPPTAEDVEAALDDALAGGAPEAQKARLLDGKAADRAYVQAIEGRIAEAQAGLEKARAGGDTDKIEAAEKRLDSAEAALESYNKLIQSTENMADTFQVGNRVRLDLGDERVTGVVINVKDAHKAGKGNPYALSKTRVTFMVNSGIRTIELPFSQLTADAEIFMERLHTTGKERLGEIFRADLGGSNRREVRYLATGNLIAASAQLDGRIVSFTDNQGRVHQGLLLPKSYKDEKFESVDFDQKFAMREPDVMLKFLERNREIVDATGGLKDRSGEVTLRPDGRFGWAIYISSSNSKKVSRAIKFDKALRDAMGGDFYGRGGQMVGQFTNDELPRVVPALMELASFAGQPSMRDAWVAAGGNAKAEAVKTFDAAGNPTGDEASFSAAPAGWGSVEGRDTLSTRQVQAAVRRIVKKLGIPADMVSVHLGEDTLPAGIRNAAKSQGIEGQIRGVHYNGKAYLVSSAVLSEAEIEEVLLHEALGHHGFRKLFKSGMAVRLQANAMFLELGGVRGIKAVAERHGVAGQMKGYFERAKKLSEAEQAFYLVDELLAHLQGRLAYEKTLPAKAARLAKEFFGAVRAWLHRRGLVNLSKFSDADLAYLLRRMRNAATDAKDAGGKPVFSFADPGRQAFTWSESGDHPNGLPYFIGDGLYFQPVRELKFESDSQDVLPDMVPGGFAEAGLTGHAAQVQAGATPVSYAIKEGGGVVATLVADVRDGKIVTIHDLDVLDPGNGTGTRIVKTVLANAGGPVKIAEALDQSRGFWDKFNPWGYDPYGNTEIDWQGYRRGPGGQPRGGEAGGAAGADHGVRPGRDVQGEGIDAQELSQEELAALGFNPDEIPAFSARSAQKSVEANIKRGRESLARALADKTTVHRAMYRNGLGWVDFVWGDEGAPPSPRGRRKGGKGLAHIIEARQRKNGYTEPEAIGFLSRMVEAIARGREISHNETNGYKSSKVALGDVHVYLVKSPRANAWVVSGYEKVKPDAAGAGYDAPTATHPESTLTRNEVGAGEDSVGGDPGSGNDPAFAARKTPAQRRGSSFGSVDPSEDRGSVRQFIDKMIYLAQDRFNTLKAVQDKIGKVPEAQDAYLAEERFHGRTRKRLDLFDENTVKPLLEHIKASGLSVDQVEEWLHARHAPEANRHLESINPDMPNNEALSGMDTRTAHAIIAKHRNNQELQQIGIMVDDMNRERLDIIEKEELDDPGNVAIIRQAYKHYVPLHREDVDGTGLPAKGRGFNVKGKETKRRVGSNRKVENILPNLVAQYQTTVVRAEKAKVHRALYELAKANPDPDFWQIDKAATKRVVGPDGLVRQAGDPRYKEQDNVLTVKKGGEEYTIELNPKNEYAVRIAKGMKNLEQASMGWPLQKMAEINRWLSAVNTGWNPEFVISNLVRDLQTAGYNLSGTEAEGLGVKVLKDWPKALAGIRNALRGDKTHEWAKHFDEFEREGGRTGWMEHYETIQDVRDKLIREFELLGDGKGAMTKRKLLKLATVVRDYNDTVENAIRLAVYVNARKAGVSKGRSASIAKNITVNFNRKGAIGPAMNAAYLFYNASIQGSARLLQAVVTSKKAQKLVGATVIFAAVLDMMNRALGDDDDDGVPFYDKVPDYVKERNLVIMRDGGDYLAIPLPWGYNVFHVLGQVVGEAMTKPDFKGTEAAGRVVGSIFGAFSPIGSGGSPLQMVAPTLLDPAVQISENKNWAGNKLMPVSMGFGAVTPDSELYWSGARDFSKSAARELNAITGGNQAKPGVIDISPETIDLWIDFATGGAGRLAANTADTASRLADGKELDPKNVPLLRKLKGRVSSRFDESNYYDNLAEVQTLEAQLKTYQHQPDMIARIRAENRDILPLRGAAKGFEKQMRKLRKIRRALKARGETERLKAVEERMNQIYKRFNTLYRKAVSTK